MTGLGNDYTGNIMQALCKKTGELGIKRGLVVCLNHSLRNFQVGRATTELFPGSPACTGDPGDIFKLFMDYYYGDGTTIGTLN